MSVLDLLAVVVVCATAITCFTIRSGWLTSLEDVSDSLEDMLDVPEKLENLRQIVIANGLVAERMKLDVERMKADRTANALNRKGGA
jgi:hypothetical protein